MEFNEEKKMVSLCIEMTTQEKPIKMRCSYEAFIGMLIVFLDEQGKNFTVAYKIYKGRSKNYLTFEKICKLVRPYILSWYPETGEKELIFETMEQTKYYTGVYTLGDQIHVQFENEHDFIKGVEEGIRFINLNVYIDDIFETEGTYQPLFKKHKLSDLKKRNIKRYTTLVSGKRRRFTLITPKQVKEISILRNFHPLHVHEENGEVKDVQMMKNPPPKKIPRRRKKPAKTTKEENLTMIVPDFS